MDPAKYEYQSEFARRYVAQGRDQGRAEGKAEGEATGKADLVLKQLKLRFGPLAEEVVARVRSASVAALDAFAERVLSAVSVAEVLGAD